MVQVMADIADLAKRNTRLIEENEAMLGRLNGPAAGADSSLAARKARRSLFGFRR